MEEANESTKLLHYLEEARNSARNAGAGRFVLGNESADLDSMASAVACGYYLSVVAPDGGV